MQTILIYDPQRVPKHWMQLLRPGQVAVFLQDVRSGVLVDPEGLPISHGVSAGACYVFDSVEEARQFSQGLVERIDHVKCDIYDERGMAVEPLYTIVNQRREHLVGSEKSARRLMLGGAFLILLSFPLFWYDWIAEGARLWPAIIGVNLFFGGIRLFLWGYGELERLRTQQQRQLLLESRSSRKAGD